MMVFRFALLVVLGSSLVIALPAEKNPDADDYDYDLDNDPGKVDPKGEVKVDIPEFISTNRSYNAVIGKDLTLACQVNKLLEETQLIWSVKYHHDKSENPQILVIGDKWIHADHNRFQLTLLKNNGEAEGNTLTVKNVTPSDAGKYICQIALTQPKEVIFDVKVVTESKETQHHTDAATSGVAQASQCGFAVMLMTLVSALVVVRV